MNAYLKEIVDVCEINKDLNSILHDTPLLQQ
jgi:hypothetical protein